MQKQDSETDWKLQVVSPKWLNAQNWSKEMIQQEGRSPGKQGLGCEFQKG